MSETLLERSSRYIDESVYEGPQAVNPVDGTFHEVADGLSVVCAFSHVWALDVGDGVAVVDTSLSVFAPGALSHLRRWSDKAIEALVYTHGHLDHVGGAGVFVSDALSRGHRRPDVVGHEAIAARFDRYELTSGYNNKINRRQFGISAALDAFETDWVRPEVTYRDELELEIGSEPLRLMHAKGETDDHTLVWAPRRRMLFCGDLFAWFFPNVGNPQKVQRYPADWAMALRRIIDLAPELLLPAHGLPIAGRERIAAALDDSASALEGLVAQTLEMMNAGARLDEIIHTVRVPSALLEKPYLRASYDEPEFAVRNIWRLYGGWHDGNPARLKPPPDSVIAAEVATLAGGAAKLARRAGELCDAGDLRLACQLAEWAAQAAPEDASVHEARAGVYRARRDQELSLMSRGLYGDAAATSEASARREPQG